MATRIVIEQPRPVRVIPHVWIPLADGTRLAARIWLPADADRDPVPALLEYIPYRKNDWSAPRDALRHPYLAGYGYACLRVDMRGSGDSEGLLLDEYLPQEQDDAVEVIAWIAAQPWCTGLVGMFGKSWGGFNALQVAARRPPQLKAIITLYSTDDRYADDIHYVGGCLFGTDHLAWASAMLAFNARPPDPQYVGDRWRDRWLERLANSRPFLETWLRHQRRDEYWKHGSVCEDFGAITCAVYAVGAWADGYTNAVPRLLAGLRCPRKGLIGPWSHQYPETAIPGPAIGFLQESLRWWDHWLKGIDTGIMAEPMLRVWLQDSAPPSTLHAERPGRWVAEPTWPSADVGRGRLYMQGGRLTGAAGQRAEVRFRGLQAAGLDAGVFYSMSLAGDEPPDQRPEDGMSLIFDSAPADSPQEILGYPEVNLTLASDRPQALLAVRLCDVAPTGESTLVSRGLLNLTHRESHEFPSPLQPGKPYAIRVRLKLAAHSLAAGHRWRVAISPTYWPWAWPSPEPVTLTLFTGAETWIDLPLRPPRPEDAALRPFEQAETAEPVRREWRRSPSRHRGTRRDVVSGRVELVDRVDSGSFRLLEAELEYEEVGEHSYSVVEGDPLSAAAQSRWTVRIGREGWRTRIETRSALMADRENFYLTNELEAYEGDTPVFVRAWSAAIARDQM